MPLGAETPSATDRAHAAFGRHAWREAYELLSKADASGGLAPDELELLAQAAWWIGRLPEAIDIRERAYGAATRNGDVQLAVMLAIGLGRDNLLRNDVAIASAWLNRAGHLLEGAPESPGQGYLAACRSFGASLSGDTALALSEATKATEIAARLGDRDLAAYATSERGFALISIGKVEEGLALIDEATISALAGEVEPSTVGGVCCTSIEACSAMGDWRRAVAWTEAQDRWCRREGINGYPGMCRIFRSEIKQLRGDWLEAEAEARQASVELEGFIPAAAGKAFLRIAELRLLRGDTTAAEEALLRGHALGYDPEPTLSLLRLAQGRVDVAAARIRAALDDPSPLPNWRATPGTPLHRLPLLRAQVEIALAADDLPTARGAVEELASTAEQYATPYNSAVAATALGAVELADGNAVSAAHHLRRGIQTWEGLAATHEVARARMLLADAHLAEGGQDAAMLELHAARLGFEQLGAAPDLRAVDERLASLQKVGVEEATPEGPVPARVVRTFAFTDIVDSTRLAELLGDDAWGKLLRWHDHVVRAIVAEHGGEEIKATGDGFFLAFADAGTALDAMIAVQRRFAEHREEQGFAPALRIGLHTAEANRAGLDYLGVAVNSAARIGAAAQGGEILASEGTLGAARRGYSTDAPRTLRLKGISEPVSARSVAWH